MSDPSPSRRAAATSLGAAAVFDPTVDDVAAAVRDLTGGLGAAGAIDAAGVAQALAASLRSTRPDRRIVVVAHHQQPMSVRSGSLIFSEIAVTGSHIYRSGDIARVIADLAVGTYPLDEWVETIDLDRVVDDGLVRLRNQEANKILVTLAAE